MFKIHISSKTTSYNYIKDLWMYRELFLFLAWRDILIRYKQAVLGAGWAIIRPLIVIIVFTIIFGKIAKFATNDVPYGMVVMFGILPWQFFSGTITDGSLSLINNAHLISKVYFPRMIIPVAALIVNLIDFLVAFIILLIVTSIWYAYIPSFSILYVIPFMLINIILSLGLVFLFSALTVKYRDVKHITPFLLQIGLYISPVGFISKIIPEKWQFIYSLNPMVGIIDGFRWAAFGNNVQTLNINSVILSIIISIIIFLIGFNYFRHVEKTFADII